MAIVAAEAEAAVEVALEPCSADRAEGTGVAVLQVREVAAAVAPCLVGRATRSGVEG
jgi:hypothetical protein